MQAILCHCCGQVIGEVPELSRLRPELTKLEFKVVEAIFKSGAGGISALDLSVKLFGDRIGGEKSKREEVRVVISNLRPKVERFGYFIPKSNRWSRYRVQPLEAFA